MSRCPKQERKETIGWFIQPLRAWGVRCCFILYAPIYLVSFVRLEIWPLLYLNTCNLAHAEKEEC